MILKSRQVNLDPEPWRSPWTDERYATKTYRENRYDPRPEFEPTRDPFPWIDREHPVARFSHNEWLPIERYEWKPRREIFDTPVNPILVELRARRSRGMDIVQDVKHTLWAIRHLDRPYSEWLRTCSPEQLDHAHRVLTRLVSFTALMERTSS